MTWVQMGLRFTANLGSIQIDILIEPYEFSDEETRARFLLLAAEALIVFGWSYDGFTQDEGFIRVDVGGRTLTLRDIAHP